MLCETRWVERYNAVLTFFNVHRPLVETSQHVTEWKDGNVAFNAEQLRVTVCQGSFIILSAFNLKRHRAATETLFIQLKTRTGGDTRCTKDRSTEA
ncbi:hypothetical protein T01_2365 [Trichinella spiralis]|uniref:Uncharacterized protein n=1 Tax=Trichinella spiralis TaxID=6334 RepID=A0A0V1BX84_TRISP|nr:hypothetical protein T01_2365 [Trichinella spiralis]